MLSQAEELIKAAIKKSDVPFLGLLGESFPPSIRIALKEKTTSNPTIHGYVKFLSSYPALFSVNLTTHIMEGMGQGGGFQLYPHIQRAIGTDTPVTPDERDKLWSAFRRAVRTLGFEPSSRLSGTHFMADEYLRQVGVPLAFADDLAQKMLAFAKKIGLPDIDDPEGMVSWQQALDARLGPPFSMTARKAISLDTNAYYTQVFLKVQNSGGNASSSLEQAMAKAFQAQPSHTSLRRASLPYIHLNDGTLGIFVAGGDERMFEFQVDGKVEIHRAGIEDRFIPLNNVLAREVIIKELPELQTSKYQLWDDTKSNRLLIFSESGRYKVAAQLNQTDAVILFPGKYFVLSRFSPAEEDVQETREEPTLYGFSIIIRPGEQKIISNGPAKLIVEGESQPLAVWGGDTKTTKEGVEFYYGNLISSLEFPTDWALTTGKNYVLNLSASSTGKRLEIKFTVDDSGRAQLNISDALLNNDWNPGFCRLLAEVCRPGESRTLLRSSIFFWFGLSHISRGMGFECIALPSNIQQGLCENITIAGNSLKPKNSLAKTLRVVFKIDERRHQTLTWSVPGVYIEIENASDSGNIVCSSKPLGSIEVVSNSSSKQILISANEPGYLSVGNWTQFVDFSKSQTKRLPASLLASRISPSSNKLMYRNASTENEIELLHLVQPHFVKGISSKLQNKQLIVKFSLANELEALSVHVEDVISGEIVNIILFSNMTMLTKHSHGNAQVMVTPTEDGVFAVNVFFNVDVWPSGAWIFRFDGQINGIWGHLENERQDTFAIGMLCGEGGIKVPVNQLMECLSELTDKQSLNMLVRVQNTLLPCYTHESWNELKWLQNIWKYLISKWSGRVAEAVTTLIDLAVLRPAEDAAPTWMLQETVGALIPEIFALPAKEYRKVNQRSSSIVKALRAIAEVKDAYPNIFPDLIHPAAALGFSNFGDIQKGKQPHSFRLLKYIDALHQTGGNIEDTFRMESEVYCPDAGDWLGPIHYKFSMRSLNIAYERSLGGNEIHRGQAIGLCRYIEQKNPMFSHDCPDGLKGQPPHLIPWPYDKNEFLSSDIEQKRENLQQIAHLLSLFAYSCRAGARNPEKMESFLGKLTASGIPVNQSLSYLLQIGEDVFAFYLLLWELVIRTERI